MEIPAVLFRGEPGRIAAFDLCKHLSAQFFNGQKICDHLGVKHVMGGGLSY
jgi:hypothetical protein